MLTPTASAHHTDRDTASGRSARGITGRPHTIRSVAAREREAGQSAIQTAVLLPLLIVLIIACVQGTLWFAGRQVAIAAASEGARTASAEHSTTQAGHTAAFQFATTTGRGFLLTPSVTVTRSDTTATVTMTGNTQSLVPGWDLTITQTASMPVERLTAPTSEAP